MTDDRTLPIPGSPVTTTPEPPARLWRPGRLVQHGELLILPPELAG